MVVCIFERIVRYFQNQYFLGSLRCYIIRFDVYFIKTFCS